MGSLAAYKKLHSESVNSLENFWRHQANEQLVWRKPFATVLNWKAPHAEWFKGGKLNVTKNCLDRHLGTARENKATLIFSAMLASARIGAVHTVLVLKRTANEINTLEGREVKGNT